MYQIDAIDRNPIFHDSPYNQGVYRFHPIGKGCGASMKTARRFVPPTPPHGRFQLPDAPRRPGERPDFSALKLQPAGAANKPAIDVDPMDIHDLAFGLIRVLDDEGQAVGPWAAKLSVDTLRQGLRLMTLLRIYDERMNALQRQGKLSFYMKAAGEEAVAIAQTMALRASDMIFPSYRQQGALIARGRELVDMMCHCLSNARDNLKGRQLPIHYSWKDGNFFGVSGNVATQFCQAVGWAMAAAYKDRDDIAISWLGDGSSATLDFHHAMTFAATYNAPVILNVVNNQWAISSHQNIAGGARTTFAARAIGYGIPGLRVDGNDFLALYAATEWAAARARAGHGPTLIEAFTYRAGDHSTSDDASRYRPKDEAAAWPLGDPLKRLKDHLIGRGAWSEEDHLRLESELKESVAKAYKEAISYGTLHEGPWSPVKTMFEDVYEDMPRHLRRQRQAHGV